MTATDGAPLPERYLLVSGDFVRTGGMDMGNYFLADYLARQGVPVHIVSHNVDPELTARANVVWHRAPRPRRSTILGEPMLRFLGHRIARRLGGVAAGTRTLVNGGNCPLPDVNWVHYVHAATRPLPGSHLLRRLKTEWAYRQFLRLEGIALRRARLILANSLRTKNDLVRHHGIDPAIIHPVYYGTNPAAFYPADEEEKAALRRELNLPADRCLIIFIGALGDRRKGFDTLFHAWENAVPELASTAALIVVGTGAELPGWRRRAAESPVGTSIHFLGFRRDVPRLLRACDALVAPTRYEAFGLAVLEALYCGLPAIVSHDAGVAELFPPIIAGLLLRDPESVSELTAKLRSLVERRRERRAGMLEIAATLRKHTWDDMAREIARLIQMSNPVQSS